MVWRRGLFAGLLVLLMMLSFTPVAIGSTVVTHSWNVGPDSTSPPGGSGSPGCERNYYFARYSDWGFHDGNAWMQLNWCWNYLGHVTSLRVSNVGCQGRGGVFCQGVIGKGSLVYHGWVRAYREFRFSFGPAHTDACIQIRGRIGGGYRHYKKCRLIG